MNNCYHYDSKHNDRLTADRLNFLFKVVGYGERGEGLKQDLPVDNFQKWLFI